MARWLKMMKEKTEADKDIILTTIALQKPQQMQMLNTEDWGWQGYNFASVEGIPIVGGACFRISLQLDPSGIKKSTLYLTLQFWYKVKYTLLKRDCFLLILVAMDLNLKVESRELQEQEQKQEDWYHLLPQKPSPGLFPSLSYGMSYVLWQSATQKCSNCVKNVWSVSTQ